MEDVNYTLTFNGKFTRITLNNLSINSITKALKSPKYHYQYLILNLNNNNLSYDKLNLIENILELSFVRLLNVSCCGLNKIPTSFKYLTELNISNNNITVLPKEIKYVIWLRKLKACDNKITIISKEIKHLKEPSILNLANNLITELPKEIKYLGALSILNIANNQLTELPKEIKYLKLLDILDISKNKITEIIPEIKYLKLLIILIASYNKITVFPKEMKYLKYLEYYDGSFNNFTKLSEITLKLCNINMSNNQITKLSKTCGDNNGSCLRFINLPFNKISNIPRDNYFFIEPVDYLNIANNNIMYIPKSDIKILIV
jgi:Leucine-rich repeat (LRR) protein